MRTKKYYMKWRIKTYNKLKKRSRLHRKTVHKLQGQINRAVTSLNTKGKSKTCWTFKKLSRLVLKELYKPCTYCRSFIKIQTWCVDHIKPLKRGGNSKYSNIQIICRRCNRAKGSVSPKQFRNIMNYIRQYPKAYKEILARLSYGGSFHTHVRRVNLHER